MESFDFCGLHFPRRRRRNCRFFTFLSVLSLLFHCLTGVDSLVFPLPPPAALSSRREWILQAALSTHLLVALPGTASSSSSDTGFVYSNDWTGTKLPLLSLQEAVDGAKNKEPYGSWPMARWPDPILRRPASPVDTSLFGTETLALACRYLEQTARRERAVGLAAQQCGIDARIIFLDGVSSSSSLTMINPHITQRSPETQMKVWLEHCLVLPPTFRATVLRDAWVDVNYQDLNGGKWRRVRLKGEAARALQHEYDHDRGILVTVGGPGFIRLFVCRA